MSELSLPIGFNTPDGFVCWTCRSAALWAEAHLLEAVEVDKLEADLAQARDGSPNALRPLWIEKGEERGRKQERDRVRGVAEELEEWADEARRVRGQLKPGKGYDIADACVKEREKAATRVQQLVATLNPDQDQEGNDGSE